MVFWHDASVLTLTAINCCHLFAKQNKFCFCAYFDLSKFLKNLHFRRLPKASALSDQVTLKQKELINHRWEFRFPIANQYTRKWWSQTVSNRRPPGCKPGALPAELWPPKSKALSINSLPKTEIYSHTVFGGSGWIWTTDLSLIRAAL